MRDPCPTQYWVKQSCNIASHARRPLASGGSLFQNYPFHLRTQAPDPSLLTAFSCSTHSHSEALDAFPVAAACCSANEHIPAHGPSQLVATTCCGGRWHTPAPGPTPFVATKQCTVALSCPWPLSQQIKSKSSVCIHGRQAVNSVPVAEALTMHQTGSVYQQQYSKCHSALMAGRRWIVYHW